MNVLFEYVVRGFGFVVGAALAVILIYILISLSCLLAPMILNVLNGADISIRRIWKRFRLFCKRCDISDIKDSTSEFL